jgi:hypothetical protein
VWLAVAKGGKPDFNLFHLVTESETTNPEKHRTKSAELPW